MLSLVADPLAYASGYEKPDNKLPRPRAPR